MTQSAIEETLGLAAVRLQAKGLLKPGDVLSQRIPEHSAFVRIRIGANQASANAFSWASLDVPPGQTKDAAWDLHRAIYSARPDVGAIAAGQLTWTSLLAPLNLTLPGIFDEQIRQLGVEVRRIARPSTAFGSLPALGNGANAYCFDDLAVCVGMGLERLLLNIEILEKCAESFVLASSAGLTVKRIPWWVKFIANGRLKKDRKDAAARHLRGERSILKAGY